MGIWTILLYLLGLVALNTALGVPFITHIARENDPDASPDASTGDKIQVALAILVCAAMWEIVLITRQYARRKQA